MNSYIPCFFLRNTKYKMQNCFHEQQTTDHITDHHSPADNVKVRSSQMRSRVTSSRDAKVTRQIDKMGFV